MSLSDGDSPSRSASLTNCLLIEGQVSGRGAHADRAREIFRSIVPGNSRTHHDLLPRSLVPAVALDRTGPATAASPIMGMANIAPRRGLQHRPDASEQLRDTSLKTIRLMEGFCASTAHWPLGVVNLNSRRPTHKAIRSKSHWALLKSIIANLAPGIFGDNPTAALWSPRLPIKRQKIRPGGLQHETHMMRIDDLDGS